MSKFEGDVLMIDSTTGNNYSLNLCSELNELCSKVTLMTVADRKHLQDQSYCTLNWAPSKDSAASKTNKSLAYILYLSRLMKYIFVHRPAIVHFQFFRRERFESIFVVLLRLFRVRVVHTAHNVLPHEHSPGDSFFKSLIYWSSAMIIAHSYYIKNMIISEFGISSDKITVIPHGNYDDCMPAKPISREEARARLQLSDKAEVLLFFGCIRKYKGIDLLVSAFRIASRSRPELKLVIAGPAHTEQLDIWCRAIINKSGLGHKIIYRPEYIPDVELPVYFNASDAVVLPYRNIYHSGVIHMAYTFGKPVIATSVGDFAESIVEGKTGFLTEKNDAASLAATIDKALSDTELLVWMGLSARRLSSSKYSWERIAGLTVDSYRSIVSTAACHLWLQPDPFEE